MKNRLSDQEELELLNRIHAAMRKFQIATDLFPELKPLAGTSYFICSEENVRAICSAFVGEVNDLFQKYGR